MKKILFILTLCFIFCSTQSYAARFGSGKSFGQQRSAPSYNKSGSNQQHHQQQHQQAKPQPHTPPPAKPSLLSRMFPLLAGLSIGALVGSLLGGHGLGGGLGSILMMLAVAGIVFYVIKKLIAAKSGAKNFNHVQNNPHSDNSYYGSENAYSNSNSSSYTVNNNDASFQRDDFLRTAKTIFIRMQNSYDTKNLSDIKNFTTPEIFAEIQMQIQERGNDVNQTDVIYINASLLDEHDTNLSMGSVQFSGRIREQQNAAPVDINEIWHFVKQDNNWLIAGIEQPVNRSHHQV